MVKPVRSRMSSTDASSATSTETPEPSTIDMALEVVQLPVSDVDRAKRFYGSLGWRFDIDLVVSDDARTVQFTPPHSGCSIQFGRGRTTAEPGSAQGLFLVVSVLAGPHGERLGLASGQCLAELGEAVEDESCWPASAMVAERRLVSWLRGHRFPPIQGATSSSVPVGDGGRLDMPDIGYVVPGGVGGLVWGAAGQASVQVGRVPVPPVVRAATASKEP
jgi:catechol 2,3-dioxygenase-like lactoylglutathione lyase family enzyme